MESRDTPSSTTRTQTIVEEPSTSGAPGTTGGTGAERLLLLRVAPRRKAKKKGVSWANEVVDNELMNKKKSKKCCIFHKQRPFGEWSDSDSECECEDADEAKGEA